MSTNNYHIDNQCIYMDNNGSAIMKKETMETLIAWCNKGNPSASYKAAKECSQMMNDFTSYMLNICKTNTLNYEVIFTSGATESNSTIIKAAVMSWVKYKKISGHVIISEYEHKSIIMTLEQLRDDGFCSFDMIKPNIAGKIAPNDITNVIRHNTCLISIMNANNEIGVINDVYNIYNICCARGIPFHSDMVQTFGKFPPDLSKYPISAMSISFHKYGGSPGVGALIIHKKFHSAYKLCPLICGTQNAGFRGGTENICGIAAAYRGLKIYWTDRLNKNIYLVKLKTEFIIGLSKIAPTITYREYNDKYAGSNIFKSPVICLISGNDNNYLPNTILLSIIHPNNKICNAYIRSALEDYNIICSIGSACNTKNKFASHVLDSINADLVIKRGTLRFSLGDENTLDEIKLVCNTLEKIIYNK